jgi:PEP-CTERM motif
MYKKLALTISLALTIVAGANGAAITWGAIEDNGFSLANGTELPAGNLARLGFFSITDQEITAAAASGNFALLNSSFTEVANARIGDGVGNIPGHFAGTSSFPNTTGGRQLMYWVLQSADNSSNAASIASILQLGIFYLPRTSNDQWGLAVDSQTPGLNTVDISDLTPAVDSSTLRADSKILFGSFPTGTSSATGARDFGLAPVPEPSTFALLGLTAVGFLARRRSK